MAKSLMQQNHDNALEYQKLLSKLAKLTKECAVLWLKIEANDTYELRAAYRDKYASRDVLLLIRNKYLKTLNNKK